MKNDTTSSLVPGEAITFGVHAFWDMSIEWKKSINHEDIATTKHVWAVLPLGVDQEMLCLCSGPGHHTWNEPELTLDYKGETCWRTEWNCCHHLREYKLSLRLLPGWWWWCDTDAGNIVLSSVCLVSCLPCVGRDFHYPRGFCEILSQTT